MELVPPGGLEPPPHGLRARCAAFTLRREVGADPGDRTRTSAIPGPQAAVTSDQRLERMAGLEPAPQGLEGPRATVTPHSRWFGLRVSNPSLRAGNAGCILHTQAERGPVAFTGPSTFVSCQRPRSCEHIRSYRPFWRQRQDSNPDPRGLEARMLPLHHAVVAASHRDRFRDKTSPRPDAGFLPRVRPKTKKAFQGIALEGLVLEECRAFRALSPPYRARRRCGD
jgi:hypothetical protein